MAKKQVLDYITIYADEQNWDAWKDYCSACGVPRDATSITIKFKHEDVEYRE